MEVVHGSALFQCGRTQSLCTVTVGGTRDSQKMDGLFGADQKDCIVHHSLPPYATNKVNGLQFLFNF